MKSIHLEPANPVTGDTVRAVVNLHNPLGLETSVQYRWRINGKVMEGEGKILSTPVHYGDVVSVEVAVSVPGQELEPVAATVMVGNAPPVVELSKESLRDGEYLASFTLKDPEGDPLQFRLLQGPEGMSVDGGQPILRWRPEKGTVGVFQVAVEAEDEAGNRTQYTFDMTVSPPQEAGDRKAAGKTP